jgi:metallophosphoesterase (TIGR00282 family)
MANTLRFIFLGDLVGQAGRSIFQKYSSILRTKYKADALIVNGENSADSGRGIRPHDAEFFFEHGVDLITTGNHIWAQKDIFAYLDREPRLLRPANFPSSCPGKGYAFVEIKGHTVGFMNVQGRVFMHELLDCPFRAAESLVLLLKSKTNMIFLDFHAETTSEKQGMSYFLDGKVSGVFGTHTHVQTADERILPQGTAYISDLGYAGALNSMLGMKKDVILRRFLTQMPQKFEVETEGPLVMHGIVVEVDTKTGKAISIERIKVLDS